MPPKYTYELCIAFTNFQIKQEVIAVLPTWGFDTFVEGVVDDLDIEFDYENTSEDHQLLEESSGPLSIYSYQRDHLEGLTAKLNNQFPKGLEIELKSILTHDWIEGWKDSFQPVYTEKFCIHPPWLEGADNKTNVIIDPGMAFGTGQHETTQLCLSELEKIIQAENKNESFSFMDVGIGSGILSIALAKWAQKNGHANWSFAGVDVDVDAVKATERNADKNDVHIEVSSKNIADIAEEHDIVIANILAVVLRKILPDLAKSTKNAGYLILSGLLVEDENELLTQAKSLGFNLFHKNSLKDWSCLVLQKNSK